MTDTATTTDVHRGEAELRWHASPLAISVATCAAIALAAAVIGSNWQLVVFAAPLLGVLCSVGFQRSPRTVVVTAEPGSVRCFESESARLSLSATAGGVPVALTVQDVVGLRIEPSDDGSAGRKTVVAQAQRWGRYTLGVLAEVQAPGGLLTGTATVEVGEVLVFPVAPSQSTAIPRTDLLDRLGTHLTRYAGPGVEYADVRVYVPGDQLRTVNWPVSARRRTLHVTRRLTDRSADVVVVIDTSTQPSGPATASTERMAHGAVQVVQSALRSGDRAGVVVLGSRRPRWLGADIGRRQFYRVLDTLLATGDDHNATTGTLAPRAALPPGAIVVAFSTLLDTEFALAMIELRKRGHVVLVVDVLEGSPFPEAQDPLIDRMWSLQRSFMYRDMATIGVDVIAWHGDWTLDQAMRLVPDRSRRRRRR